MNPALKSAVVALWLVTFAVGAASAQAARARVKQDGTTIWRAGFLNVATVVSAGTELEVVARSGDFLEVVLPAGQGAPRTTGFIVESAVELSGTVPDEAPSTLQADTAASARQPQRPRLPSIYGRSRLRVFGTAGYERFSARRTFDALFEAPGGPLYGAGAEYQTAGGIFVQGGVDYLQLVGQRVFVSDGEVFRLGIRDVVTILPVSATVGFRLVQGRLAPYGGAGFGRYFFRDDYAFADADAKKYQSFPSYHVIAGVEWWAARHVGAAFEAQYVRVPKALEGGVGADLGEDDLGGFQVRVKFLYGR